MHHAPPQRSKLTLYIGIALLLGITAGFILNKNYVGSENTKIANAEVQLKLLLGQMKPYEKIKDSTFYNCLLAQQKSITAQKKDAEQRLLNSEDGSHTQAT